MSRIEHLSEGVKLYLGDCREILPTLGRFDAVVTDPPYRLTSGGNTKNFMGRGESLFENYGYENCGEIVPVVEWNEWLPLISNISCEADYYIMSNDKNLGDAINAAKDANIGVHNILVWRKSTAVANRWYFKDCEFTVYGWTGNARTIRHPPSKQQIYIPLDKKEHPTQKPVQLMAHYISNSTDFDGNVLDPFMGSGTTGVASVKLGRKFTGIELEPKYFDIACRRISESMKQPDLFIEQPKASATQEALL